MISVSLFRLGIIGAREIAIFFKNGSGGFDLSQNRRMAMCSAFWPQKTSCHNCGFFIPAEQHSFFLLTLSACYLQTNLIFPQLLCQLFLYICKATTNATTNNPMHHMTARNLLLPGSVFRRNIRTESITWAKGRFLTNILVYFII